jgi:hypothetical protein
LRNPWQGWAPEAAPLAYANHSQNRILYRSLAGTYEYEKIRAKTNTLSKPC